ncbi:hypothetical protein HDU82_006782 [Entophlyctis luteolus]|nr:hypothetical protein HDU82_006782 [Entophlyctis luteolus]
MNDQQIENEYRLIMSRRGLAHDPHVMSVPIEHKRMMVESERKLVNTPPPPLHPSTSSSVRWPSSKTNSVSSLSSAPPYSTPTQSSYDLSRDRTSSSTSSNSLALSSRFNDVLDALNVTGKNRQILTDMFGRTNTADKLAILEKYKAQLASKLAQPAMPPPPATSQAPALSQAPIVSQFSGPPQSPRPISPTFREFRQRNSLRHQQQIADNIPGQEWVDKLSSADLDKQFEKVLNALRITGYARSSAMHSTRSAGKRLQVKQYYAKANLRPPQEFVEVAAEQPTRSSSPTPSTSSVELFKPDELEMPKTVEGFVSSLMDASITNKTLYRILSDLRVKLNLSVTASFVQQFATLKVQTSAQSSPVTGLEALKNVLQRQRQLPSLIQQPLGTIRSARYADASNIRPDEIRVEILECLLSFEPAQLLSTPSLVHELVILLTTIDENLANQKNTAAIAGSLTMRTYAADLCTNLCLDGDDAMEQIVNAFIATTNPILLVNSLLDAFAKTTVLIQQFPQEDPASVIEVDVAVYWTYRMSLLGFIVAYVGSFDDLAARMRAWRMFDAAHVVQVSHAVELFANALKLRGIPDTEEIVQFRECVQVFVEMRDQDLSEVKENDTLRIDAQRISNPNESIDTILITLHNLDADDGGVADTLKSLLQHVAILTTSLTDKKKSKISRPELIALSERLLNITASAAKDGEMQWETMSASLATALDSVSGQGLNTITLPSHESSETSHFQKEIVELQTKLAIAESAQEVAVRELMEFRYDVEHQIASLTGGETVATDANEKEVRRLRDVIAVLTQERDDALRKAGQQAGTKTEEKLGHSGLSSESITLPDFAEPIPPVPLKPLEWSKLRSSAVKSSAWLSIVKDCYVTPQEFPVTFLDQTELASVPKIFSKPTEDAPSVRVVSNRVMMLETDRSRHIEILLAALRGPDFKRLTVHQIRDGILEMSDTVLTLANLNVLVQIVPTEAEIQLVNSYKGDPQQLASPEKFVKTISTIPRLQQRLDAIVFAKQLPQDVVELRTDLATVSRAARILVKSERLRRILQSALLIGNYVNGGTYRGHAYGFEIKGLLKLKDTTANPDSGLKERAPTLMHYLARRLDELDEDFIAEFKAEIADLEVASRVSIDVLFDSIAQMKSSFEHVEQELSISRELEKGAGSESPFANFLASFSKKTEDIVKTISASSAKVEQEVREMVAFFGHKAVETQSALSANEVAQDIFKTVWQFQETLGRAMSEIKLTDERTVQQRNGSSNPFSRKTPLTPLQLAVKKQKQALKAVEGKEAFSLRGLTVRRGRKFAVQDEQALGSGGPSDTIAPLNDAGSSSLKLALDSRRTLRRITRLQTVAREKQHTRGDDDGDGDAVAVRQGIDAVLAGYVSSMAGGALGTHSTGAKASRGVVGAAVAGFLELFMFHPLDTAAKRLINHRGWTEEKGGFQKVVFKDAAEQGLLPKVKSLYRAFGYAVGYKMLQRSLQFGSHPIVNDYIKENYLPTYKQAFGDRWAMTWISGTSGIIIGTFEVILLPLDALKVKRQTGTQLISNLSTPSSAAVPNTPSPSHTSPFRLFLNLYRGGSWTAARNSVGLFALFGTSTFVKENVLGASSAAPVTVSQLFVASLAGAFASIAVAAPFDVIKVRMQATSIDARRVSGLELLRVLLKTEGVWALTKGVVPKMIASGPKVAFSFTIAQWLAEYFAR